MIDVCPVCGAPATFIHSDEGTNAVVYDPSAIVDDVRAALALLNNARTTIIDTDARHEWEAERARLRRRWES